MERNVCVCVVRDRATHTVVCIALYIVLECYCGIIQTRGHVLIKNARIKRLLAGKVTFTALFTQIDKVRDSCDRRQRAKIHALADRYILPGLARAARHPVQRATSFVVRRRKTVV